MGIRSLAKGAVMAAAVMLSMGCATVSPWARHDRMADVKVAAADPSRTCDVEVLNATDEILDLSLVAEGEPRSLGRVTAGQSVRLPVACRVGRVSAFGVSQDYGLAGGQRYRAAAPLDRLRETRLRLTHADEVGR